jgi:hypothetical protein
MRSDTSALLSESRRELEILLTRRVHGLLLPQETTRLFSSGLFVLMAVH